MKTLNVKVKFVNDFEKNNRGEKLYDYLTFFDDLEEGDLVAVGTRHGYAVAEFVEYSDSRGKGGSYIVDKIDTATYEAMKDKAYKIKKLKEDIDERAKKVLQRKKLDELAVGDQELKTMLDTVDSLEA